MLGSGVFRRLGLFFRLDDRVLIASEDLLFTLGVRVVRTGDLNQPVGVLLLAGDVRIDFRFEARRVHTTIVLGEVIEERRVGSGALRACDTRSSGGHELRVLAIENGVGQREHDVLANPLRQLTNGNGVLLLGPPVLTERRCQSVLLLLLR